MKGAISNFEVADIERLFRDKGRSLRILQDVKAKADVNPCFFTLCRDGTDLKAEPESKPKPKLRPARRLPARRLLYLMHLSCRNV